MAYVTIRGSRLRLLSGIRDWMPWADVGAVLAVVLIVGAPALFTDDGFAPDFTNHLWLAWVQTHAISSHLVPTYFISAPKVGVFYPFFLFYGGTLYAVAGAVGAVFAAQHAAGYIIVTLGAIAAAYGGFVWLARQVGVRGWMAHAPAIAFVASAYYITNIYGRGAWTEFAATSAIPLLIASAWRLLHSPRVAVGPAVLLVLSTIMFSGSHNITLLLGSLVMIPGVVLLRLAVGTPLTPFGPRRMIEVAVLLVLGLAVNAWFLLPDVIHASDTQIGKAAIFPWADTGFFNTPAMLFNPLRAVPSQSTTPALYVQAPMWFLLWILPAAALSLRRAQRNLRRIALVVTGILVVVLALIMIGPVWDAMPRTFREVQLPFRLNTYVALCIAWLVLICVVSLQTAGSLRARRGLGYALAGVMLISASLAVWQLFVPRTHQTIFYGDRRAVFTSVHQTPRTLYDPSDYVDVSGPPIATRGSLNIPPEFINSDYVTLTLRVPPGSAPFATNIAGGPYAVQVSGGLVRVGRTANGYVALRRAKPGTGPVTFSIAPGGRSLVTGRIISLAAMAALLILLVWSLTRSIRERRPGRMQPPRAAPQRQRVGAS